MRTKIQNPLILNVVPVKWNSQENAIFKKLQNVFQYSPP
jgi:hypothetical protein